jgi:hypothetical protein
MLSAEGSIQSGEVELPSKDPSAIERLSNEILLSITDLLDNYALQCLARISQTINITAIKIIYRTVRLDSEFESHGNSSVGSRSFLRLGQQLSATGPWIKCCGLIVYDVSIEFYSSYPLKGPFPPQVR